MPQDLRVVVTGASGNVGTAVLRALRARHPQWQVVGIARRPPGPGAGEPYDTVDWRPLDLSDQGCEPALAEAFTGADAVVHLAWAIMPSTRPGTLAAVNLDGTARVLAAARDAGVRHLVHASSLGAYSPVPHGSLPKPVVDESWPVNGVPTSLYSRHKAAVERMLDAWSVETPETPVARIRPGLVLQPRAGAEIGRYFVGPLAPLVRLVIRGVPVLPLADGLVANVLHADDVGDAVARILDQRATGAFNLAADDVVDPVSLAAAFRASRVRIPYTALRSAVSLSWHLRIQPTDPGWLDLARAVPLLDTSRAKRELGWSPAHSGNDALAELVAAVAQGRGGGSPVLASR